LFKPQKYLQNEIGPSHSFKSKIAHARKKHK
jgi:hypothetical protein